jgi:ABC-type sugar transport system ATPase subunit
MSAPAASLEGVGKAFGATRALDGVDFDVRRGEIHALVGENGAGKSTLIRILGGVHRPDRGVVRLDGEARHLASPREAIAAGIVTIPQELRLVPALSIAENIALGDPPRRRLGPLVLVDRARMRAEARALLAELDYAPDPDRPVGRLPYAERQLVAIARALRRRCRIFILDEPTAALARHELDRLFAVLGRMRAQGTGIVYISHRLDEVVAIADRCTVLRDGRVAASAARGGFAVADLVAAMTGEAAAPDAFAAKAPGAVLLALEGGSPRATTQERPALAAATASPPPLAGEGQGGGPSSSRLDLPPPHPSPGISAFTRVFDALCGGGSRSVSLRRADSLPSAETSDRAGALQIRAGEVVGLAGLLGSGAGAMLRRLFATAGPSSVRLRDAPRRLRRPADAIAAGIGMVPGERSLGLVMNQSVRDNIMLPGLARFVRLGVIDRAAGERVVLELMDLLDIRPRLPGLPARALSGGNQQKAILAKWLARRVAVLLLEEPTQGIDVAAKAQIHALIRGFAARGGGALIYSSELSELARLCDRVLAVRAGGIAESFERERGLDEASLRTAIGG